VDIPADSGEAGVGASMERISGTSRGAGLIAEKRDPIQPLVPTQVRYAGVG
jgi:hypothetical protein